MKDIALDALSVLDPVSLDVTVQGEQFSIKQFKFLESLKVLKIVKTHPEVMELIFSLDSDNNDKVFDVMLNLADIAGDALASIVQIVTKKDAEWMANIELDEVMDLALAITKANRDFFTQTLLPKLSMFTNESSTNEKA